MRLSILLSSLAALLLAACPSTPDHSLRVDLVTDYAPGVEAARALVQLDGGEAQEVDLSRRDAAELTTGVPVAQFDDLAAGVHEVVVELQDGARARVGRLRIMTVVRGRTVVPAIIARSCEELSCPPPSDPERTECFGVRCVPPECTDGSEECGGDQCEVDADCPASGSTCAVARCAEVAGVRLCLEEEREGACGADEVCAATGCEPRPEPGDDGGLGDDAGVPMDDAGAPADGGVDDGGTCMEGAPCEVEAGSCQRGRTTCEGGVARCVADGPLDSGTTCRAATGPCDVAEVCDGSSLACPADGSAPVGQTCALPDGGEGFCDESGSCSDDCTPGAVCDAGPCALGRVSCAGGVPACVPDTPKDRGTLCRASASGCDAAERCDGSSLECPEDVPADAGTPCRAAAGQCDVAESCTGSAFECPMDAFAPTGTACTVGGEEGACVGGTCTTACVPGAACDTGNPCEVGEIECSTGSPRCVATGTRPDDFVCGTPTEGPWGSCGGFGGDCDTTGTQSRTVTERVCDAGTCVSRATMETRGCSRTTDGDPCGMTSTGAWSTCGGFDGTCGEAGTQSRTITDFVCGSGSCQTAPRMETRACSRDTDGVSCGTDGCGGWGSCGGFTGFCDETGTQSRTCTSFACSAGSCDSSSFLDTRACSRSRDGQSCGTTMTSAWGTCGGYSGTCDESGTQSRTVTTYSCASDSCRSSTETDVRECFRDTDGVSCGMTMTSAWGSCGGFTEFCDESGTQSRTVTEYECVAGGCDPSVTMESRACSRSRDGQSCGTTMTSAWGPCGGFTSDCDQSGTQTRTVTTYSCGSDSCQSSVEVESRSCTRNTEDDPCGGGLGDCGQPGSCSSGVCQGAGCPDGQICVCIGQCGRPGDDCE
ncbi:MAG TPA: hypothetical protein RMH85_34440 [Polyangiaceae bacterium LLY-WYZ-15_(1-7)]|nr:hypothetical protein [Polyangiaceae bacterium LLY-WYZ-15_(1-7)]HJL13635.1 hypothetical protein [Polyangiaceae bacterium LLY-WYZ-15_(1-7)]HJL25401.1 hypothetical protein [Polyangiaceae bacterium LLY-WYZ-15_(1-7)]HJL34744.1 hypothetical protein [Polyangiaceae bacterium LLY-WYZ-15_(1-7)]HJL49137.1 hypothetical protein [Polyangiaceae bacterium LLY-WYZ-15_(1-7)]